VAFFTFKNVNQKIENGKLQMKHFNSIKKNSDFQKVYKTGKSYANRLLVMYVKEKDGGDTRIGISVSKKVGNSVVRHHVTRLIRESFRLHQDMVKTGLDIVVVARAAAREAEYKKMESAYLHLCGLHNILENRSEKID
jgi:ribonuclease P protein component